MIVALQACAPGSGRELPRAAASDRGLAPPPLALVNGAPVTLDDLGPELLDRAGGAALDGHILDRAVDAMLRERGLAITPEMVEAERRLLTGSAGGPDEANASSLRAYQRSTGLSEALLGRQLRRNAALRALVDPEVQLTPERLELEHRVRHGERLMVRIIVLSTAREAQEVRERLVPHGAADEVALDKSALSTRLASEAFERSIDPSSVRGGLLGAVSVDDPRWPLALRRAAQLGRVGELSGVIGLPSGYAVLLVESRLAPTGVSLEEFTRDAGPVLLAELQRVAMDALARRLIAGAVVVPMAPGLRE